MPTSISLLAYGDCFDYFDQALADPQGIAIIFDYSGDARQFRLRMNAARKLDREENAKTYQDNPEHPLFGRSQYDGLTLKLREGENGKAYVIIVRYDAQVREVISLSDLPEDLLLREEPKALPKPVEVVPLKLEDRRF